MAKGLLDFVATPEGQGLLSAAFGGLAGARRGQPINSLGRAGLAGLAGYSEAQDRALKLEETGAQTQYRNLQMQGLQNDLAQKKAQQEWRTGLSAMMQPKLQGADEVSKTIAAQNGEFGDFGVQSAAQLRSPVPGLSLGADQQALQSYLMRPESPFADKMLERKLLPKETEAFTLSPGQTRYGTNGQPVASVPEKAKKTALEEMLDSAGITDPATRQGFILQGLKKQTTHAPAASATIINKQETEEAKSVGKFFGDAYATVQNAGFSAQSKVNRYNRLGQLLEGVNTGKFAGAGLEVAKAANTLGFNIDPNMANKEAAQALSGEIALELRNPSGGAGMPGAMSDADRQFLVNMVPGLATTPDGRKLMLETGQKLAKRDMEVARIAREYRKRNGTIDEGFYDELSRYSESNPLFQQAAPAQTPGARGLTIRRVR